MKSAGAKARMRHLTSQSSAQNSCIELYMNHACLALTAQWRSVAAPPSFGWLAFYRDKGNASA
ncbi:MAG: hypothetical protein WBG88_14320 [Mesorhizobium sp.]